MAGGARGWVVGLFAGAEAAEHSGGVFVWVLVQVGGGEVVASKYVYMCVFLAGRFFSFSFFGRGKRRKRKKWRKGRGRREKERVLRTCRREKLWSSS